MDRKGDKCKPSPVYDEKYQGCSLLHFQIIATERPPTIDGGFWILATASGELCGCDDTGSISISAEGLIPLGVYTLWFATDRGFRPAAPVSAEYTSDGYDPNRLVVNSKGTLNYYIAPLDFNPFYGIPITGSKSTAIIQRVVIGYNFDRMTHGTSPGQFGVNFFEQLSATVDYPCRSEDDSDSSACDCESEITSSTNLFR